MYNLLVSSNGWPDDVGRMNTGRMLAADYTKAELAQTLCPEGAPDFESLKQLPCLFLKEGRGGEIARVGRLLRVRTEGQFYLLEYAWERSIPEFRNSDICDRRADFGLNDFEFNHTHWAVKDFDLFRSLLRLERPQRALPTVFRIDRDEAIDDRQISVMMPFDGRCAGVYEDIKNMVRRNALKCNRADDIWQHDHILQDIVSLIDKSKIVICDLTGKNPNVLYEAGIAHTLGRNTILLTQNSDDVPFDLKPIRYISYLNNVEGRAAMVEKLERRIVEMIEV